MVSCGTNVRRKVCISTAKDPRPYLYLGLFRL
jgi:hypothetical protein